jgi:hypothetical protein
MLDMNPVSAPAGFGASGASAIIREASAEGPGVMDGADRACVGPASSDDSVSGPLLTNPGLFTGDVGASNAVLDGVPDSGSTGSAGGSTGSARWAGLACGLTGSTAGAWRWTKVRAAPKTASALRRMEVIAPPVLCTIPSRGSTVAVESDAVVPVFDPPEACAVPDGTVDEAVVGDESDGSDGGGVDAESEAAGVSAKATPGVPATPNPTPNATANAPTRPIYRA